MPTERGMRMAEGPEVGRISVRVLPDTSRFRRDLKGQLERIEQSARGTVQVDVELDSGGAQAHMRELMARLKAQAAKGVNVRVGVDGNAISRGLANIGNGITGALGNVNPGSIALIAAAAALAAPALALVSGALVSLPALLTAAVVPIAAVALGLDGLKKAAEVLKEPLDGLKATMSTAFQEKFTPVFERLRGIFPLLNAELPKVTQGLADMAGALVDSVTSAPGMDKIRNTIGNIGAALSAAAPGIGKFTDGILSLVSSVSDHLPGLSQFFNQFADRFLTWVDKITKKDWFGNSPLSSAMGSLKESLQGVADLVARLGTEGFKLLSDPKMGENIRKVFDGIKTFVTDTLPALNKGFDSIATAVAGISDKWNAIEWAVNPLGKLAENIGPVAGGPGINVNSSGIDVFNENLRLGKILMSQLMVQALTTFGTIKANAAQALSGVWDTLTTSASAAWNGVVAVVSGAVAGITGTVSNIGNALSAAWSNLGSIASTAWQAVVSAVTTAMANAVSAVVQGAGQVVSEVAALGGKVTAAAANFGSLLVDAGKALIQGLINGIGSLADAAVQKAKDIATSVANAVKGALGIHSPSVVFHGIGEQTMAGLANGLDEGSKSVLDKAKSISDELGKAIVGPGNKKFGVDLGLDSSGDTVNKVLSASAGFAEANIKQFTSDLGISGNGAISQLAEMGLDWGKQAVGDTFNFQVNSIDEALGAKQRLQAKKALQFVNR